MNATTITNKGQNAARFLMLAELCEEQLLACRNGDLDRIAELLRRKEDLLALIDFRELDADSAAMRQAATQITGCDEQSALAMREHCNKMGVALQRIRAGRTTRKAYAAVHAADGCGRMLDRHE